MPKILLVNKQDAELGYEEKLKVHKLGLLHRSFSVLVFNSQGELLLQKRAEGKYHSGGLWSNTCCSHQESRGVLLEAARRRLREEMGLDSELKEHFHFVYKVGVGNGLIENELDHVFIGFSDDAPKINKREASDYKYVLISDIRKDIKENPGDYTEWFKIIIKKYLLQLLELAKNK